MTIDDSGVVGVDQQKKNLAAVWANPMSKVILGVVVLLLILLASWAVYKVRGKPPKPDQGGKINTFAVDVEAPRGAVDPKAFNDKVKIDADKAAAAAALGKSYIGDFTFAAQTGSAFDAGSVNRAGADPATTLRIEADRLNKQDIQQGQTPLDKSGAAYKAAAVSAVNIPAPLSREEAESIAKQLDKSSAFRPLRYESVVATKAGDVAGKNGVTAVVPQREAAAPTKIGSTNAVAEPPQEETTLIEGGEVCPVILDSAINTDLKSAVIVTIQGCGELAESRLRGTFNAGPDNLTVAITGLLPKKGFKYRVDIIEAELVNLDTGSTGIAKKVDRHWLERLSTAALLKLAQVEQQTLAARGQQTTSTGTTTTQSVDRYTPSERRDARIAGAAQGVLEVVAKDTAVGVNRPVTLSTPQGEVLGVRFLRAVKGVKL
ncbi:MAG: hypothetical protein JNM52_05670 [Betaproteobacteria bacterium]|nr:hypothetical protein [Betaproteobacteria bacterium]